MNVYAGQNIDKYTEHYTTETGSPDWVHRHTIYHTPKGDLHQINQVSTKGEPGYTVEHVIKEPEDLDKLLSMEYTPFPLDRKSYDDVAAHLGDRGVVMLDMPHAAYFVQILMGMLEDDEAPRHIVVDAKLVARESVASIAPEQ